MTKEKPLSSKEHVEIIDSKCYLHEDVKEAVEKLKKKCGFENEGGMLLAISYEDFDSIFGRFE